MVRNNRRLAILMSSYNGAKYIREQIDSIIGQSFTDWTLYIRDDGSTDETLDIIKEYEVKDSRIKQYCDNLGNIRVRKSFMTLLENIDSDYYAFSDQDDIWLNHKLQEGMDALQGKDGTPVLFNSDVTLVDGEGNLIQRSYWQFAHLHPEFRFQSTQLIVNPSIIGMTMIFNKEARNVMIPYSGYNLLHDSWCSIQVSLHGTIISSKTPSVLYRQHCNNVCGIEGVRNTNCLSKLLKSTKNNITKYKTVNQLFDISFITYIKTKAEIALDRKL